MSPKKRSGQGQRPPLMTRQEARAELVARMAAHASQAPTARIEPQTRDKRAAALQARIFGPAVVAEPVTASPVVVPWSPPVGSVVCAHCGIYTIDAVQVNGTGPRRFRQVDVCRSCSDLHETDATPAILRIIVPSLHVPGGPAVNAELAAADVEFRQDPWVAPVGSDRRWAWLVDAEGNITDDRLQSLVDKLVAAAESDDPAPKRSTTGYSCAGCGASHRLKGGWSTRYRPVGHLEDYVEEVTVMMRSHRLPLCSTCGAAHAQNGMVAPNGRFVDLLLYAMAGYADARGRVTREPDISVRGFILHGYSPTALDADRTAEPWDHLGAEKAVIIATVRHDVDGV